MVRFDSAEHLYDWQRTGRFPRIHDDIYNLIRSEVSPSDGDVLDLGASTGLLARRLAHAGYAARAIEADEVAIAAGKAAGTYGVRVPVRQWLLTSSDMVPFWDFLVENNIQTVVARRVLPELDDSGVTPEMLGEALSNGGVKHLFLEGRAPRQGARHRLRSVSDEVVDLEKRWKVNTFDGMHRAYLTLKE